MKDKTDVTVDFLKVLSDRTRLEIIELLRNGSRNSKDIQDALGKSQSTISQQLKVLIQADIVEYEQDGVKKEYSIKNKKIFLLLTQINDFLSNISKDRVDILSHVDLSDVL